MGVKCILQDQIEIGRSNPNLLDNWYFADPINQRGQTEYKTENNSSYTIDRWMIGWNTTCTLTENSVLMGGAMEFFQRLSPEILNFLEGKAITMSALDENGELYLASGIVKEQNVNGSILRLITVGGYRGTFIIKGLLSIVAAKIELGLRQTLARQDVDGNWVLNDPPPNKQQELSKCQRYFVNLNPAKNTHAYYGSGTMGSQTEAWILAELPTVMRIVPSALPCGNLRLVSPSTGAGSAANIPVTSLGTYPVLNSGGAKVMLRVTVETALTVGQYVMLSNNGDAEGNIHITADL